MHFLRIVPKAYWLVGSCALELSWKWWVTTANNLHLPIRRRWHKLLASAPKVLLPIIPKLGSGGFHHSVKITLWTHLSGTDWVYPLLRTMWSLHTTPKEDLHSSSVNLMLSHLTLLPGCLVLAPPSPTIHFHALPWRQCHSTALPQPVTSNSANHVYVHLRPISHAALVEEKTVVICHGFHVWMDLTKPAVLLASDVHGNNPLSDSAASESSTSP